MPLLPRELTDTIMEHLQFSMDYNTLLACCFVCRAFLPAAQSKLHFAVHIEKCNVKKVSEHLTPNVAQYVRELYLHSFHENSSWLSDGPLVVILHQLLRLQKMRLQNCTWSALSSDLRAEIIRIFQGQCFHHIQIFGVESFPITLLESFANLRRLEISSISLESPSQDPPLAPSVIPIGPIPISATMLHTKSTTFPVYLETLGLAVLSGENPSVSVEVQNRDMISALDFLLSPSSPLNVSRLRTISFDTDPLDEEFERSLSHLLNACFATISCIKMYGPVYTSKNPFGSTCISFEKLHCLESLVILIPHTESGVVRWLAHVLGTIEPLSRIKKDIQIVFVLHDDYHEFKQGEWESLDTVFTLPGFTSLSRLIVEWSVYPGALTLNDGQGLGFENLIKSKLSHLNGRNILEVREMRLTHNDLFSLDRGV